jgi:hypothetical protein
VLLFANSSKCSLKGIRSGRGAQKNMWSAIPHTVPQDSESDKILLDFETKASKLTSKSKNKIALRSPLSLGDFLLSNQIVSKGAVSINLKRNSGHHKRSAFTVEIDQISLVCSIPSWLVIKHTLISRSGTSGIVAITAGQ